MLEILSKNHNTWIAMGLSIGIPDHMVEDFIHETYLRLNKYIDNPEKIMYNETEVNKFYVYITIKNLWSDFNKAKSKHTVYKIDDYNFEYVFDSSDLNNKIIELEQQLLLANQTDPEHPFFRNGSLVAESVDGQRTGKFYYMDKGYKRKVAYNATFYKTLLSVLGYSTSDDYPEASKNILSQIKTGPDLSEGNFEQSTFIESGELYVGENVNDDTKDARINALSNEVRDLTEDYNRFRMMRYLL